MTTPWWLNVIWVIAIFCDGANAERAYAKGKMSEWVFWLLMAICCMVSVICYCYTHKV